MSALTQSKAVSYDQLVAAALLPPEYQAPVVVLRLPYGQRKQLLHNPLTPVARTHDVHEQQRALLRSFVQHDNTSYTLRMFSDGLLRLLPAAWDFIVEHGKPDYTKVSAAVEAGTITDMDGPAITSLYNHWLELQRFAQL